ncbi:MAG: hypothetical protein AAF449_20980 [Myxococcota bacterium]
MRLSEAKRMKRWWRRRAASWAAVAIAFGISAAYAQPFAGDPDAKDKKTKPPAIRNWTVNEGGFSFSLEFNPGVPDPGQMVEIIISVARIPSTPHPTYGNRIPQRGARFVLEMIAPDGARLGRYLAHPLPLTRGRYGVHLTPTQVGLHSLRIRGKSSDGRILRAETKLPVKVWPLPANLRGTGDEAGSIRRRRPIVVPR